MLLQGWGSYNLELTDERFLHTKHQGRGLRRFAIELSQVQDLLEH